MQHDILVDQFEQYLAGHATQEFHDHLAICPDCRREVAAMETVVDLFHENFRAGLQETSVETAIQPPPGFYNRLAGHIVERQRSEFWGLFSPGVIFFRRVALASLLLLAGLGGFLVTREVSEEGADAVSIMAQHDVSSVHSESADRDHLLVTLANYR
jgi:anti-sigma factor RsiW